MGDKIKCSHITKKIIKIISSFRIIKHYVSAKCKLQIFYAHVNSQMKYGIEVFGHTTKNNIAVAFACSQYLAGIM